MIYSTLGKVVNGSAIEFTVTIPTTATHVDEAIQFVQYLISPQNSAQVAAEGLPPVANASFYGNLSTVPSILLQAATGAKVIADNLYPILDFKFIVLS